MAISESDKNELDRLQRKKQACDIVAKRTNAKIAEVMARQYAGKNIILCKEIAPPEPPPKTFAERQKQRAGQMFCHNLNNFVFTGTGYSLKSEKKLHIIFSFAGNIIEYLSKEDIANTTADAMAELASRRLRWTSAEIYGTEEFKKAMSKACKKIKLEFSTHADELPQEPTATDTTPASNLLRPTSGSKLIR